MIRFLLWVFFIASIGSIITGFFIKPHEWSEKLIGLGTVGLFVIVFPIFSYIRWKDKKLEDYMLTKENIEKMRKNNEL